MAEPWISPKDNPMIWVAIFVPRFAVSATMIPVSTLPHIDSTLVPVTFVASIIYFVLCSINITSWVNSRLPVKLFDVKASRRWMDTTILVTSSLLTAFLVTINFRAFAMAELCVFLLLSTHLFEMLNLYLLPRTWKMDPCRVDSKWQVFYIPILFTALFVFVFLAWHLFVMAYANPGLIAERAAFKLAMDKSGAM